MASIRKVKFTHDVFKDGAKIHAVGEVKDATPEAERWVGRGKATLLEIDPQRVPSARQIKAAEDDVAEAREEVTRARAKLEKAPADRKAPAQKQVEAAEADLVGAEARIASMQQALTLAAQG